MRELVSKNKRRSAILIVCFFLVIAALGYVLTLITDDSGVVFVLAMAFGCLSVLGSYFAGDKLVLASVRAQRLEKQQDPELYNLVENLAMTAGIPMPKLYVIPDQALNAFATGRSPEHASMAITIGLRRTLTKNELEAVIGHELSHIKNYDIRLLLLTAVLVGMIVFLSDFIWRIALFGDNDNRKSPFALIGVIAGLIIAPLAAQLIKLALSRRRELLADADAVLLTRYPEGLISALQKIQQAPQLRGRHNAIAHLFIFPPFTKASFWSNLFSTHPPLSERMKIIEETSRIRN